MQAEADHRRSHIYMLRSNQIDDTGMSSPRCGCIPNRLGSRGCWYFNVKGHKLIDSFYSYVLSNNFYYHVNFHRSLIHRSVEEEEEERARKKKKTSPVFLPPDILMDIISRLPVMSILRLQSVSRDWNEVSCNPLTLAAQIAHAKRDHLAIHPGEGRQEVHMISSTPDRPEAASVVFRLKPLAKDIVILGSINGIPLLQEKLKGNMGGRLYLYNPLLGGGRLPLPMDDRMRMLLLCSKCGFSFDQARSEFKVVLMKEEYIEEHGMMKMKISIHACVVPMVGGNLGNPRPWTLLKEELFDGDRWSCHLHDGPLGLTLLNDKLHCLIYGNRIVAFDIVNHEITYLDFFDIPNVKILRIGELGDRLFAITCTSRWYEDFNTRVMKDYFNIWMMKDYGNPESMTKEIVLHQQCILPFMIPYMLNEHEIFLRDSQKGVPYMIQHNPTLVMSPSGVGGI